MYLARVAVLPGMHFGVKVRAIQHEGSMFIAAQHAAAAVPGMAWDARARRPWTGLSSTTASSLLVVLGRCNQYGLYVAGSGRSMSRTACGMPLSRMLLAQMGPEKADSSSHTTHCNVVPVSLGALQGIQA